MLGKLFNFWRGRKFTNISTFKAFTKLANVKQPNLKRYIYWEYVFYHVSYKNVHKTMVLLLWIFTLSFVIK